MAGQPDSPVFPLRVIDLTRFAHPDQLFYSLEALGTTLEAGCEWDTDEPEYAEEVLILDALNRPVRLKVMDCVVVLCELYELEGWSEQKVKQYVERMRLTTRLSKDRKQSLFSWLSRLWKRGADRE